MVVARIGISLALVGIMAQPLVTTGLGSKIASLVHLLSGGSLLLALLLTMLVALILGCSVPPAAAYALCAVVVVPTIVPLGADLLAAHFFTFYFAIISAITPPVGLASLAAAGLAGGNFLTTGLIGFRMALAGFLLPFMIVYNPVFVFDTSNAFWFGASLLCIPLAITAQTALTYNCFLAKLTGFDSLLALLATVLAYVFVFAGGSMDAAVGGTVVAAAAALFGLLIVKQRKLLAGSLRHESLAR